MPRPAHQRRVLGARPIRREAGRWRFECAEAVNGDLCGNERELLRLLGLTVTEIRLDTASVDADPTVTLGEFVAHRDETAAESLIEAEQGKMPRRPPA